MMGPMPDVYSATQSSEETQWVGYKNNKNEREISLCFRNYKWQIVLLIPLAKDVDGIWRMKMLWPKIIIFMLAEKRISYVFAILN